MSCEFEVAEEVFFLHPEHSWVMGHVSSIGPDPKAVTPKFAKASSPTGGGGGPHFLLTCTAADTHRSEVEHGSIVPNLRTFSADVFTRTGVNSDEDVNDLLELTVLHDATLLRCLYLRYMRDVIYTNIGAIVVAFNPFTFTIPWYKDENMQAYLNEGNDRKIEKNLPHSWAVAHDTYVDLFVDPGGLALVAQAQGQALEITRDEACRPLLPQFILISGESGSGKTEASKIVVKYLTALSNRAATSGGAATTATATGGGDTNTVGYRLQQCSPILEAFGNARTVRNDNSSRFGKFMKIQFSPGGVLLGAQITRYLLEKSRVVTASKGERVYHAFYLAVRSGPLARADALNLAADTEYKSLSSGSQLHNPEFDTEEDFNEVAAAMRVVGVDDAGVRSVWATVGGVLALLNATFAPLGGGSDGCKLAPDAARWVADVGRLWALPPNAALAKEIVETESVVRGEVTVKALSVVQATDARDALCKALYDSLFAFLAEKCNAICDAHTTDAYWIGLLDIFGFEDFEVNSFEQLCINLANETLQGHYNQYVFARDLKECEAEGINTLDLVCPDNGPCLELISDPRKGIFALLDDQCSLGKATDVGFLEAATTAFGANKHPDFIAFKVAKTPSFGIRHYAGNVTYVVSGFLDKNRDTLKDGLRVLLRSSADPIISELIAAPLATKTGRALTVAGFFRQQLAELMKVINTSNPHWIRCVKPHPAKKPRMLSGRSTMSQLESSGVLGTVKIRKAGYPVRMPFGACVERFHVLMPEWKDSAALFRQSSGAPAAGFRPGELRSVVDRMFWPRFDAELPRPTAAQVGKTKLFLKSEALATLESLRKQATVSRITRIQSAGRGFLRGRRVAAEAAVARQVHIICAELKSYCQRTTAVRAERAERMRLFRQAMQAATDDLLGQYTTRASEAVAAWLTACLGAAAVVVGAGEQERRLEILNEERAEFVDRVLGSAAGEMLSKEEAMRRTAFETIWDRLWAVWPPAFHEHLQYLAVCFESDERRNLEHTERREWRDANFGPRFALVDLLDRERCHRAMLVRDGLRRLGEYTAETTRLKIADLVRLEWQTRAALSAAEDAERGARKRFEQVKVWTALERTVHADEHYDRSFLWRIEQRDWSALFDAFLAGLTCAVIADSLDAVVATEAAERRSIAAHALEVLSPRESHAASLFAAMRHGADRIRLAEIAREEATFRTYVVQTYKAEFVLLLDAAFPAQLQRVAWPAPFA